MGWSLFAIMTTTTTVSDLREIPGIGPSIEQDLLDLGIHHVGDLRGKDPEELYDRLCHLRGAHIDRGSRRLPSVWHLGGECQALGLEDPLNRLADLVVGCGRAGSHPDPVDSLEPVL